MKQNGLWILGIIFVAIIIFALFFSFRNNDDDHKKKSKGKCPVGYNNRERKGSGYKIKGCPYSKTSHYSEDPGFEFKYLFHRLKPCLPEDVHLEKLATSMVKPITSEHHNEKIPAGYTFLGQFLAHDITFNVNGSLVEFDGTENTNFRSPQLDLDSVYSGGKHGNTYIYDNDMIVYNHEEEDLPRNHKSVAIIGDPRNDENLLISQLHLLFIKFHNKVMASSENFDSTKNSVVWTYQYIIVHDFLKRFCGNSIVNYVLRKGGKFYNPRYPDQPFMPHEFAIAALRFGHGTILNSYKINDSSTYTLQEIFERRDQVVNWKHFFGEHAQHSKKLHPHLAETLGDMPIDTPEGVTQNSLPLRNLKRGKQFKLTCGQRLARKMKVKKLSSTVLAEHYPELKNGDMHEQTPMWYYMMAESEIQHDGHQLGSTGAILLAEVIIGILQYDHNSFLHQKHFTPIAKNMHELCEYVNRE